MIGCIREKCGWVTSSQVFSCTMAIVMLAFACTSASCQVKQEGKYAKWQDHSEKLRTDPGLVAYYDFEEGQGGVLKNKAKGPSRDRKYDPRELDGSLGGGKSDKSPTWTTSRWPGKKALLFDGVDDYVDCGKHEHFDSDTKTIEVWFKLSGFTDASYMAIVDKAYWGGANQYGYGINIRKAGSSLRGYVVDENQKGARVGAHVEPGTWYHLVLVHDYGKDSLCLYLNGELQSKSEARGFMPHLAGSFKIGRLSAGSSWYLSGIIDEIAVYNRPLRENEVKEHYEIGRPSE